MNAETSERLAPLGFRAGAKALLAASHDRARPRSAQRDAAERYVTRSTRSRPISPRSAVTSVTLFRSRLSPKGSQYEVVVAGTIVMMLAILLGYLAGSVPFAFLLRAGGGNRRSRGGQRQRRRGECDAHHRDRPGDCCDVARRRKGRGGGGACAAGVGRRGAGRSDRRGGRASGTSTRCGSASTAERESPWQPACLPYSRRWRRASRRCCSWSRSG